MNSSTPELEHAAPVGRPLLSGFYATFNAIVPQGSGVALLRSPQYLEGKGARSPLVTLAIWAAAGCLLAVAATVVRTKFGHRAAWRPRLNYRAGHERYLPGAAGRDRAVLRPGLLSPAD